MDAILKYIAMRQAQPLKGLGDSVHQIHTGTEFEAELRFSDLETVAATISRLTEEREEARALVTEANNSLYGSQSYFHSLNGGPFDKYHLASGIEELKRASRSRDMWKGQCERQADRLTRMSDLLRWLNDRGGLGRDAHARIRAALATATDPDADGSGAR